MVQTKLISDLYLLKFFNSKTVLSAFLLIDRIRLTVINLKILRNIIYIIIQHISICIYSYFTVKFIMLYSI